VPHQQSQYGSVELKKHILVVPTNFPAIT